MSEKLYGKICWPGEGVVRERKFNTEAETLAYVRGAKDMKEQIDPDDEDEHIVCADDQKAKDD